MFCTGGGRALKIRQVHAPLPPAIQLAADRAVCPVLLLRNPIKRSQHSRSCEPPDDFPCKKTEAYPTDSKKLSSGAPWMGPPLIGIYRPLHPRLVWHDKGNDQTRPNTRDNSGEEFPVLLEHGLSHRVEPLGPTKGTAKHPSGMAQSQRDSNPVEKSREACRAISGPADNWAKATLAPAINKEITMGIPESRHGRTFSCGTSTKIRMPRLGAWHAADVYTASCSWLPPTEAFSFLPPTFHLEAPLLSVETTTTPFRPNHLRIIAYRPQFNVPYPRFSPTS